MATERPAVERPAPQRPAVERPAPQRPAVERPAPQRPALEPIRSTRRVRVLTDEQLDRIQAGTLEILERVGVQFPSEIALRIFEEHGATVDRATRIVRLAPDIVHRAMAEVPRTFTMAARDPAFDLPLEFGTTYFTLDGSGTAAVDRTTGEVRPSRKSDLADQVRVADYLSSIGFMWPTVSAQDHGRTSQLHELDAMYSNSVKHVQGMVMGAAACRYAVEIATVIAGTRDELRRRPNQSLLACTVSPLLQDHDAIEGALVFAEAGLPVGLLSMPVLGTTAPARLAGALVVADAEIIAATVLLQLAYPGAPVFHSIMQAWADPRSGAYVGYSRDGHGRYAPVDIAHRWGMPSMAACFGTESPRAGTWQSAAEVALDPLMAALTGPEIVTGLGLSKTYTTLYPESIILDDDLYHRARCMLLDLETEADDLALDVIASVGPAGHYLYEPHTRTHMKHGLVRGVTNQPGEGSGYRDPVEFARERAAWILANHEPEPLAAAERAEIDRILAAADEEIR